MGGVYILYSIFFLVDNYNIVYIMINVGIGMLYLSLAWTFYSNTKANIKIIDNFLNELNDLEDDEQ